MVVLRATQLRVVVVDPDTEDLASDHPVPEPITLPVDVPVAPPLAVRPQEDAEWVMDN
jgi:hypothetical protein